MSVTASSPADIYTEFVVTPMTEQLTARRTDGSEVTVYLTDADVAALPEDCREWFDALAQLVETKVP